MLRRASLVVYAASMLEKFRFAAEIDIPLVVLTLVAFLVHFECWAKHTDVDTNANLRERLPKARLLVIGFFCALLAVCWSSSIAFWAILVLGFGIGVVLSLMLGGTHELGLGILLFAAYLIREWAFGFPQLLLQPPNSSPTRVAQTTLSEELVGATGKTLSPLRPCGEAEIDGKVCSVMSADSSLIDSEAKIVVTGKRNGTICVRLLDED